jgi:hypothetical protein
MPIADAQESAAMTGEVRSVPESIACKNIVTKPT